MPPFRFDLDETARFRPQGPAPKDRVHSDKLGIEAQLPLLPSDAE